jgi:hypothetical protein
MVKGLFSLPSIFPRKKILSIDIGGTLAKVAFYLPKDDVKLKNPQYYEKLTKDSIPCKFSFIIEYDFSRIVEWRYYLFEVLPLG